jgi:hypothetical protein
MCNLLYSLYYYYYGNLLFFYYKVPTLVEIKGRFEEGGEDGEDRGTMEDLFGGDPVRCG